MTASENSGSQMVSGGRQGPVSHFSRQEGKINPLWCN